MIYDKTKMSVIVLNQPILYKSIDARQVQKTKTSSRFANTNLQ